MIDSRLDSYTARVRSYQGAPANCNPANGDIINIVSGGTNGAGLYTPVSSNAWGRIDVSKVFDVTAYGAIGNGAADTTASIQAAINAAALVAGMVRIPTGQYRLTGSISIPDTIALVGNGAGSILLVDPSVGALTDILIFRPVTNGFSLIMRDFTLSPSGAAAGRHNIFLDGINVKVSDCLFENIVLGKLNGTSFHAENNVEGTPILTIVRNCVLANGFSLPNCGDTVRFRDCHIAGTEGIDVTQVAGASTFVLSGCSVTCAKGIHLGKTVAPQIVENEFETLAGFTGSNGAFLDIDGAAGAIVDEAIIARNSFQIVNGITTNSINVNFSNGAMIFGNRLARGAGISKEINITANAVSTVVGINSFPTSAVPSITDLGTGTVLSFLGKLHFLSLPSVFANNAAAIAGGLTAGDVYRNNADPDHLCIVH